MLIAENIFANTESIHEKFIRQCEDLRVQKFARYFKASDIFAIQFGVVRRRQTYRVNQIDLFKDGAYNWDVKAIA